MDHFSYKKNSLHAENVAITDIAKIVGTPFYCYSTATLERHYHILADVFLETRIPTTLCFAVKACPNIAVLKTLGNLGAGADTVSEGEIRRARAAGIPARKIVFSGVGKTREEMRYALKLGISQFNVESRPELEALHEEARSLGTIAPIALRVNPDVDAGTHEKIATGRKTDKFGIAISQAPALYRYAATLNHIKVVAISTHIGSQLTSLKPFEKAFKKIVELLRVLRRDGHDISRLDLGGGLGVPYDEETPPNPKSYAQLIARIIKDTGCALVLEPGRVIVGNAGILVAKVLYVKEAKKNFVIIDAAMNDLLRPSLYEAHHTVVPVIKTRRKKQLIEIVGPVCETGDVLARNRNLPQFAADDLLAFRTAGAYGASMSNTYNSRRLIPEVLVKDSRFSVIRTRQSYEDMLAAESLPDWIK